MRLIILLLLVGVAVPAAAQESDESLYVIIDYAKAKTDRPVSSEREIWMPYWQAMADAGHRESWTMYAVWWGFDQSYSHVWVHTAKSLADFSVPAATQDSLWAVAHPNKDVDSLMAVFNDRFEFVRSEFWQISASVGDLHGEMMMVAYMQVPEGGGEEYLAVERDIWKPMKALHVDEGSLDGWAVLSKWWPGGTDYPYGYAALNWTGDFASIESMSDAFDFFEEVHPDQDAEAVLDRTLKSRSVVRSELWNRRLHVHRK